LPARRIGQDCVLEPAVAAHDGVRPCERANEGGTLLAVALLGKLLALFCVEPACAGERRDGRGAADRGAREDPADRIRHEQLDERLGLALAVRVERTQTVVALPPVALDRARVADEEQGHERHYAAARRRSSSSAAPSRTPPRPTRRRVSSR